MENDLLYKIEVLKAALIAEKKKTGTLQETLLQYKGAISNLENELNDKDKEILSHTKEKFHLIEQLDLQRYSSEMDEERQEHYNGLNLSKRQSKDFDAKSNGSKQQIKEKNEDEKPNKVSSFISAIGEIFESAIRKASSVSHNDDNDGVDHLEEEEHTYLAEREALIDKINTYEITIENLEIQNQTLRDLFNDSHSSLNLVKVEFQKIVSELNSRIAIMEARLVNERFDYESSTQSKIKYLEDQVANHKEELSKFQKSTTTLMNLNKSLEMKLMNSEASLKKVQLESNSAQSQLSLLQADFQKKVNELSEMTDAYHHKEADNLALAKKLAELKTAMLDDSVREKLFTGYKKEIFTNTTFTLTLTKSSSGAYILLIKDDNSKEGETVLIENIDHIKLIDETHSLIEIKYLKDKKIKAVQLNLNSNPNDLIKAFKDFQEKALLQSQSSGFGF